VNFADPDEFAAYDLGKLRENYNYNSGTWADNTNLLEDRYLVNGMTTIKVSAYDDNGFDGMPMKFLVYDEISGPAAGLGPYGAPGPLYITPDNIRVLYSIATPMENLFKTDAAGQLLAKTTTELQAEAALQYWITGSTTNVNQISIDTTQGGYKTGQYHLYVYFFTVDKAGNYGAVNKSGTSTNLHVGLDFWVDPDTDKPQVKITRINENGNIITSAADITDNRNLLDANAMLEGTFYDDDAVDLSKLVVWLERTDDKGNPLVSREIGVISNDTSVGFPGVLAPPPRIGLEQRLLDNDGNKLIKFTFDRSYLAKAFNPAATAQLTEGIYRFRIQAWDGPANRKEGLPGVYNYFHNFEVPPGGDNNEWTYFAIDSAPPAVNVLAPEEGGLRGNVIDVKVEVSDDNGPVRLAVIPQIGRAHV
jgi:hypothetical protein